MKLALLALVMIVSCGPAPPTKAQPEARASTGNLFSDAEQERAARNARRIADAQAGGNGLAIMAKDGLEARDGHSAELANGMREIDRDARLRRLEERQIEADLAR